MSSIATGCCVASRILRALPPAHSALRASPPPCIAAHEGGGKAADALHGSAPCTDSWSARGGQDQRSTPGSGMGLGLGLAERQAACQRVQSSCRWKNIRLLRCL
eukprot:scaffold60761_cov58-Phaeocystis_antarctica.AAC.8